MGRRVQPKKPAATKGASVPNRLATYGEAIYELHELGSLFHNANLGVASQVKDPYKDSALVFACIRVRAQAVATAPLVLYASTKDDAQTIESGPLFDVLANPNPWMSWRRLAYMTQVFKDLPDGACYWLMYGPGGEYLKPGAIPVEIWPLRGAHCKPVDDPMKMIPAEYEVSVSGKSKRIPAAAILPILDMDPSAYLRGFSPSAAVASEVETLFGLSQYDRKMAARLGLPSVVMQTDVEMLDEQIKAAQSKLEERLGPHNAGKPVVVGNGFKPIAIGQTAADMGHKDLREWERDMILAAFGVTKPLLGITDDVNRANADAAVQVFWRGTAVYLLRDLEDDIQTRFVRTRSGPERAYACGFDTSTVPAMQENATEMIANLKVLSDMGVSVPIGAKLLGWDVDEELLEQIEAQAEAKKAADAEARAAAAAAFAGGSVADDDEEDEQPQPPQQLARPSKEQREKQRAAILDEIAPLEARLAKKIAATQRDYVLALRKGLDKYAKLVARTPATTLATPEEALEAVLSLAPPLSEFTPQLAKEARPILEAMFKKSAEALAAELGKSPLSITGPEAAILITKRVQLVEGTLTTLSAEVTDALAKALVDSAGFSSASLAEAVQGALETMRGEITHKLDNLPQRAGTIARTETASVQGAARHAEMVAQGVERHEWISDVDDATRDSHAELNGKVVKVGESFRDDITLRWVGDPAAPIGETVNCFPGDVVVASAGVQLGYRRMYDGPMLRLSLRSGRVLSVTPNHPLLTERGWVAARDLNAGDNLIRCRGLDVARPSNPNVQRGPAAFSEVLDALHMVGDRRGVRALDVNFHGDGEGGEVDVVRPERELLFGRHAALSEQVAQSEFAPADSDMRSFAPLRDAGALRLRARSTTERDIGGEASRLAVLECRTRRGDDRSFGPVARAHSRRDQASANRAAVDGEGISQRLLGFTGEVSTDQVVGVDSREFRGHVFNLQTRSGWYVADGIVAHNCRCAVAPVIED
jgi:SPP1 gp7 family putative phage head morphogenesis protein